MSRFRPIRPKSQDSHSWDFYHCCLFRVSNNKSLAKETKLRFGKLDHGVVCVLKRDVFESHAETTHLKPTRSVASWTTVRIAFRENARLHNSPCVHNRPNKTEMNMTLYRKRWRGNDVFLKVPTESGVVDPDVCKQARTAICFISFICSEISQYFESRRAIALCMWIQGFIRKGLKR